MASDPFRVDTRGMRCPWPALRAARMLRDHSEILLLADDPIAPGELRSLAREKGWTLMEKMTGEGISFYISR
jgi:tRNA 2-thiouridine synthesizing protein A